MVQKCLYQIVDLGREENLKALIEWWEVFFFFLVICMVWSYWSLLMQKIK